MFYADIMIIANKFVVYSLFVLYQYNINRFSVYFLFFYSLINSAKFHLWPLYFVPPLPDTYDCVFL